MYDVEIEGERERRVWELHIKACLSESFSHFIQIGNALFQIPNRLSILPCDTHKPGAIFLWRIHAPSAIA